VAIVSDRIRDRHRRQARTDELMGLLHDDQDLDAPARAALVNEIIVVNTPVARQIAHRFRGRGCALEDLEQAACLALVRAVHQFDPGLGHHFLSYVVPCITGEIKRYFRDIGWMVRPPRPIQELQSQVERERLRVDPCSGRVPSESDIAARLDVPVSAVREALLARGCFTPSSLDSLPAGTDDLRLGDHLVDPTAETDFNIAEARVILGPALTGLSDAETSLLRMWFLEERSQRDIGRELGISQSHVSRRIGQVVRRLRGLVEDPPPVDAGSAA
jgi:RNA polymerase sigma-B factor